MNASTHQLLMSSFLLILILVSEAMGQNIDEVNGSFIHNMDFRSIMVGVVGFWGGVFAMGSVYLLMVLAKRVFHPEEAEKSLA